MRTLLKLFLNNIFLIIFFLFVGTENILACDCLPQGSSCPQGTYDDTPVTGCVPSGSGGARNGVLCCPNYTPDTPTPTTPTQSSGGGSGGVTSKYPDASDQACALSPFNGTCFAPGTTCSNGYATACSDNRPCCKNAPTSSGGSNSGGSTPPSNGGSSGGSTVGSGPSSFCGYSCVYKDAAGNCHGGNCQVKDSYGNPIRCADFSTDCVAVSTCGGSGAQYDTCPNTNPNPPTNVTTCPFNQAGVGCASAQCSTINEYPVAGTCAVPGMPYCCSTLSGTPVPTPSIDAPNCGCSGNTTCMAGVGNGYQCPDGSTGAPGRSTIPGVPAVCCKLTQQPTTTPPVTTTPDPNICGYGVCDPKYCVPDALGGHCNNTVIHIGSCSNQNCPAGDNDLDSQSATSCLPGQSQDYAYTCNVQPGIDKQGICCKNNSTSNNPPPQTSTGCEPYPNTTCVAGLTTTSPLIANCHATGNTEAPCTINNKSGFCCLNTELTSNPNLACQASGGSFCAASLNECPTDYQRLPQSEGLCAQGAPCCVPDPTPTPTAAISCSQCMKANQTAGNLNLDCSRYCVPQDIKKCPHDTILGCKTAACNQALEKDQAIACCDDLKAPLICLDNVK